MLLADGGSISGSEDRGRRDGRGAHKQWWKGPDAGDNTPSAVPEESHFQLREYGLAVRQESVQKYQSKSA
jgi:hypothetical protein